jgi:hypothetical protein
LARIRRAVGTVPDAERLLELAHCGEVAIDTWDLIVTVAAATALPERNPARSVQ